MNSKICKSCKIEKELTEFNKNEKYKFGVTSNCKQCVKKYSEKYRKNNKEKIKESNKKNSERLKEYQKEYYKNNTNNVKQNQKKYRENNKDKIKEQNKKWRQNNKEKLNEKMKDYYKNNKEKINEYIKKKKQVNELFKLTNNIRSLIYSAFKNKGYKKNTKTNNIIGCSFEELKNHLESQFKPWMSWENYALYNGELNYGWDIDHIIPVSSARNEEELLKLNHYTNLQPLCSYYNRCIKRDNISK
jgi:hypothetical protein